MVRKFVREPRNDRKRGSLPFEWRDSNVRVRSSLKMKVFMLTWLYPTPHKVYVENVLSLALRELNWFRREQRATAVKHVECSLSPNVNDFEMTRSFIEAARKIVYACAHPNYFSWSCLRKDIKNIDAANIEIILAISYLVR